MIDISFFVDYPYLWMQWPYNGERERDLTDALNAFGLLLKANTIVIFLSDSF